MAAHEIGHALGLEHSGDPLAVMNAVYPGTKTDLTADDTSGIRQVYSSGQARSPDANEGFLGNNSFFTATLLTINGGTQTALATNLDLTTTIDADFYKFIIPAGTSGTLTVKVQSAGLSLLAPKVYLYNSLFLQKGFANGTGQYGTTLSIPLTPVAAGQLYYLRVIGADTSVFGTGKYAITLNTGTGADPIVPLPNTQTANGNPLVTGGSSAEMPDQFFAGGGLGQYATTSDSGTVGSGLGDDSQPHAVLDNGTTGAPIASTGPTKKGPEATTAAQRGVWERLGKETGAAEAEESALTDVDPLARKLAKWLRRRS